MNSATCGASTRKEVVTFADASVAFITPETLSATARLPTEKVAVDCPAAIVTLAGTVTDAREEVRVTTSGSFTTLEVNSKVAVVPTPPATTGTASESFESLCAEQNAAKLKLSTATVNLNIGFISHPCVTEG